MRSSMHTNILDYLNKHGAQRRAVVGFKSKSKAASLSRHDTFFTLWSLVFFFKVIGLATFTVCRSSDEQRRTNIITFVQSTPGTVYNIVLSCLMLGSNYFFIPSKYGIKWKNTNSLTIGMEVVQCALGVMVVCVIFLAYCFDQKTIVGTVNRLLHIEREYQELALDYNLVSRSGYCGTCFLLLLCIVNASLATIAFISDIVTVSNDPIIWFADVLPAFIISWFVLQYFLILTFVEVRFGDFNEVVRNLSKEGDISLQPCHVYVTNSVVDRVVRARRAHGQLCEISGELSDFYSVPILFSITFVFLTVIYNGYYFIVNLFKDDQRLDYISLVNIILWMCFLLYPLILLTNRVTRTLKEINRTGDVVHTLLAHAAGREVKAELESFSIELLHRRVLFTACGFFVLDNTLLHSMIGAVTTYLVILIQFHIGSR